MDFLADLKSRHLLAQLTREAEFLEHINSGVRAAYVGYDPTGDSLTAGHLLPTLLLARWQRAGGKAIVVMGSGTAMVGDPSGKTDMRRMLTLDEIENNKQRMKRQLERFLDLSDPSRGIVVDNGDWLRPLNYLSFLRDIGPHFSVNRMLTADSVKLRLEKGLSFLEFNYMLLQSYDFLYLFRDQGCTVQIGGDDQWSNMLGGMELIRRMHRSEAFCLTIPLLTTPDGTKMGKTEKGALWLDPEKTSPYEFFQYWRNCDDRQVTLLMKMMTFMGLEEIQSYESLEGSEINGAKEKLAWELTHQVHGREAADEALMTSKSLFSAGGGAHLESAPTYSAARGDIGTKAIVDVLTATGCFASKGEVRRLIAQNGLQVGELKVDSPEFVVSAAMLDKDGAILVKKGKKHYYRIVFSD